MSVAASKWGVPVHGVAAIERELARQRRDHQRSARTGVAIARSSVLNLVVYATREAHAERAAATIAELARRHPARAVIILSESGGPPEVDGLIVTHCDAPLVDRERELCYEQVFLHATGDTDRRIASAVVPLLVSDLPVFLWWTGTPPFGARHFQDLVGSAGRVVVDSADFARAEESLPQVATLCIAGRGRYGCTDLSWTRLTAWREMLAQLFDVGDWRPFADGVTGVRISYAVDVDGRQSHPSEALLFFGWLSSRLGWTASEPLADSEAGGHLFATRRADGTRVLVRLRPHYERALAVGDMSGVRIQARAGARIAEFALERSDATHAVATVSIDGALLSERTMLLPVPTVVQLLGEELTIMASDPSYEQALAAVVAIG